jgi:hypothetical protein
MYMYMYFHWASQTLLMPVGAWTTGHSMHMGQMVASAWGVVLAGCRPGEPCAPRVCSVNVFSLGLSSATCMHLAVASHHYAFVCRCVSVCTCVCVHPPLDDACTPGAGGGIHRVLYCAEVGGGRARSQ